MKESRSAKKPTTDSNEGTAAASPSDVDLPVDGGVRLQLPGFEGPLDLLLHLIQEHELDILDIPVAFITKKYLEYIHLMEVLNIDIASEYLVMAATLAHIKSRMLLPTPPADLEEGEEEELDPRAELIRRLLEYQKYKKAGEELASRSVLGRDIFVRGALPTADPTTAPLAPVGSFKLLEAFQRVLARAKIVVDHQIEFERFSLSDRINQLVDLLKNRGRLSFEDLFEGQRSRADLIVTFLAILELTRLRMTRVFQDTSLAPIYIELSVDDEGAQAHATTQSEESPEAAATEGERAPEAKPNPPVNVEPTGDVELDVESAEPDTVQSAESETAERAEFEPNEPSQERAGWMSASTERTGDVELDVESVEPDTVQSAESETAERAEFEPNESPQERAGWMSEIAELEDAEPTEIAELEDAEPTEIAESEDAEPAEIAEPEDAEPTEIAESGSPETAQSAEAVLVESAEPESVEPDTEESIVGQDAERIEESDDNDPLEDERVEQAAASTELEHAESDCRESVVPDTAQSAEAGCIESAEHPDEPPPLEAEASAVPEMAQSAGAGAAESAARESREPEESSAIDTEAWVELESASSLEPSTVELLGTAFNQQGDLMHIKPSGASDVGAAGDREPVAPDTQAAAAGAQELAALTVEQAAESEGNEAEALSQLSPASEARQFEGSAESMAAGVGSLRPSEHAAVPEGAKSRGGVEPDLFVPTLRPELDAANEPPGDAQYEEAAVRFEPLKDVSYLGRETCSIEATYAPMPAAVDPNESVLCQVGAGPDVYTPTLRPAGESEPATGLDAPATQSLRSEESPAPPSDDPEPPTEEVDPAGANMKSMPEVVEPFGGRLLDVESLPTEEPVVSSAHSELEQKK